MLEVITFLIFLAGLKQKILRCWAILFDHFYLRLNKKPLWRNYISLAFLQTISIYSLQIHTFESGFIFYVIGALRIAVTILAHKSVI